MYADKRFEVIEFPIEFKPEEQWRKDLMAAAQLIREKGWVTDYYETSEGYCIVGAVSKVTSGNAFGHNDSPALYRLDTAACQHFGVLLHDWNDKIANSKEDVISFLEFVAKAPDVYK